MDRKVGEMIWLLRGLASEFFEVCLGDLSKDSEIPIDIMMESPIGAYRDACQIDVRPVIGEFLTVVEEKIGIPQGSIDGATRDLLGDHDPRRPTLENFALAIAEISTVRAREKERKWIT